MVIGVKDAVKLIGMSIIACCAIFVCTLFLNYQLDLVSMQSSITTPAAAAMYEAQVSMGKVTCAVTGGCLAATSVVMLLFYVKDYIDTHGKNLGILKALGYSRGKIAKHFWVFGCSVFLGCAVGFCAACAYLPRFYQLQNAQALFPDIAVRFHPWLACLLVFVPALFYSLVAILYARRRLKRPALDLLRERQEEPPKLRRKQERELPFLQDLRKNTRHRKKSLVFFIAFSAFCFSAMTQMSLSMKKLSSGTFAFMIITIGLVLAFTTLFLSLTTVLKANTKTLAMLRVFGYSRSACSRAILGGYRPVTYVGFALGTLYQYVLLKLVVTLIFADIDAMPEYRFDFAALAVSLIAFVTAYELILYGYSRRIKHISLKSIMSE